MSIQDTLLCLFSFDTKRFGTVYFFLKPKIYGEGGTKKFNNGTIWDEMGQNGALFWQ